LSRTITSVLGKQRHELLELTGRKLLVIYGRAGNTPFAIVPGWFVGNEKYEDGELAAVDVELIDPMEQFNIEQKIRDSLSKIGKQNIRISFWGGKGISENPERLDEKESKIQSKILVVDDDPAIREIIRMSLEREGYTVRSASDSREAIDVLRNESLPNLMLLDIMMPGEIGWQLLKELESDPKTSQLPVIAISGLDKPTSPDEAEYDSKMLYDYLVKPFSMTELLRVVKKFG
jgi:CheY-like chemotaxis protein